MAVDSSYVYWTNYWPNTIGRANLDGTGVNQNWITGCLGPDGIALTPSPTITSFTPNSGGTGTTVTITGTNFTGTTAVRFGGTDAQSYTVDSPTQITAVVGNGSSGNVTVITPGGTATSAGAFSWTPPPPAPKVPALSEWGMILFGLLLLGSTVFVLRKRRNAGDPISWKTKIFC